MKIEINNNTGEGKISYTWKERWIILTKGCFTMEPKSMKTFINCLFGALINMHHQLPKELKNTPTDISKDKISIK